MFGYIYKTTNTINGKIYIGQSRGKLKPKYFGSGMTISKALRLYGKNNFKMEVICQLTNKEQLDEFEKFLIDKYRGIVGRDNMYNIADGGMGGWGLNGELNGNFGKKPNEAQLKGLSLGRIKGRKFSEEGKRNISESKKGNKHPMYGKTHKPSTKLLMALAALGRKK